LKLNKLNILLFILAVVCLGLPSPAPAQMNVQIEQGQLFLDVATETLSVGDTTPVIVGTLPRHTRNIMVTAFNGDVLVGNQNELATGTVWTAAYKIASGTTIKIDGLYTRNPGIWFLCNNALTAIVKIAAWGGP